MALVIMCAGYWSCLYGQTDTLSAGRDSSIYQKSDFHFQNTYIVQGYPGFHAKYSGPNSLNTNGEVRETATLDIFAGMRLWHGAEAHADFLTWQGFGLGQTFGIEAFPNGDAYKAGTDIPNITFAHLFIRQTIGLGGTQETVHSDPLTLAGKQDISRLTFVLGRFSPLDICDDNAYAKDPHTQFMNWAMMTNLAWDYGQDQIGYTTGLAVELYQPKWSLHYGFFQMPAAKNGFTADDQLLMFPNRGSDGPFFRSWAMMLEFEHPFSINTHPGVIRFMLWLDDANFASYKKATALLLANPPDLNIGSGAGVTIPMAARAYQLKYGVGLNIEQELFKNIGAFSRIGWNNGQLESWTLTDVSWTASLGVRVKGEAWHLPADAFGLAYIISGASKANQNFLKVGGTDMLDGDGTLNYSPERVIETYYNFKLWKPVHVTLDYQFIANPAFNCDRGPVNVFSLRAHIEF